MSEPTAEDWVRARDVRDAWVGDNGEVLMQAQNGPLAQHIAQAIADERERAVSFIREAAVKLEARPMSRYTEGDLVRIKDHDAESVEGVVVEVDDESVCVEGNDWREWVSASRLERVTSKDKVQAAINRLNEAMTALHALDESPDTESLIGYAANGIGSALGYLGTALVRTELDQQEGLTS